MLLGSTASIGAAQGVCLGTGRHEGMVYMASNEQRLDAVDIADLTHPVVLDSELTSDRAFDVPIVGNTACVVALGAVLRLIDPWDCPTCHMDINDDHTVDTLDVLVFLGNWTAAIPGRSGAGTAQLTRSMCWAS